MRFLRAAGVLTLAIVLCGAESQAGRKSRGSSGSVGGSYGSASAGGASSGGYASNGGSLGGSSGGPSRAALRRAQRSASNGSSGGSGGSYGSTGTVRVRSYGSTGTSSLGSASSGGASSGGSTGRKVRVRRVRVRRTKGSSGGSYGSAGSNGGSYGSTGSSYSSAGGSYGYSAATTPSVSHVYASATPAAQPSIASNQAYNGYAVLVVKMPKDGTLFLDNREIASNGETRKFKIPVRSAEKKYSYPVRVKVGSEVAEYTGSLQAGKMTVVTASIDAGDLRVASL